jgi:hypothetical protein
MEAKQEKKLLFVDAPVATAEADKFQHSAYVETLKKIITECETPINIGIFGKWGAGKTTIINLLRQSLRRGRTHTGNINFLVPFDVWKYSGDSLRRQFLIHLNAQLPERRQLLEIDSKLYATTEEESDEKKPLLRLRTYIILGIALIILIYLLQRWEMAGWIAPTVAAAAVSTLGYLLKLHESLIISIRRKKILPRVESPEQFEKLFEAIIEKFDGQKIVIVFDNLDRCAQDVVVHTLTIIQTFLEKPKCIFLIPCDDDAIKAYINRGRQAEGNNEVREGQELLRKFFQASVVLTPYLEEALETYAYELLDQVQLSSEITDDKRRRLVQVVVSGYSRSPRRIKQTFNNLITSLVLAQEKERQGLLAQAVVTGHPDFLAKLIVLREEWPDFYGALSEDHKLLDYVEQYFQAGRVEDQFLNEKFENVKTLFSKTSGLDRFL